MPYAFRAYTEDRKVVEGVIDAVSEEAAEQSLYQSGYRNVLTLKERPAGTFAERYLPTLVGVRPQDVIDFSREMATLVRSGITVLSALELLQSQVRKAALRTVIAGLVRQIADGRSFSEAAGRYPNVFSHTYCRVVYAAERAGSLEAGLSQMAAYMEKQKALSRKAVSALTYPALVVGMAIIIVIVLMVVAMPPLVSLFAALDLALPVQTRALITVYDFIGTYRLQLIAAVLLLAVAGVGFFRLPAGRLVMSRLAISLPGIGPVNHERHLERFCRSAAMLLRAGLRLPDIVSVVSQTVPNLLVRRSLDRLGREIIQGQSLSRIMAADGMFPPVMVGMVAVGEKTGDLEGALENVADYYERSVDRRTARLVALVEPVITIAVGLVVAFVVMSLISPLYSVLGSISAR